MDSYKEYMIDLLHAPFKKVKREVNHWKILMKVLGEEFDQVKESIFRIRDQSAIHTATSSRALDIIGDGMRMKRFEGEDDERFRKRLLAKRAIAEMAGTRSGIRYAMKSLGFEEVEILPPMDPLHPDQKDMQRWAEFILRLNGKRVPIEHRKQWEIIQSEVRRVKQASSKLAGISLFVPKQMPLYLGIASHRLKDLTVYPSTVEDMEQEKKLYLGVAMSKRKEHILYPATAEDIELSMSLKFSSHPVVAKEFSISPQRFSMLAEMRFSSTLLIDSGHVSQMERKSTLKEAKVLE